MQAVTLQALEAVSARLRDKKLPVRKEAALQLAAVFRCVRPTNFALWVIQNGQATPTQYVLFFAVFVADLHCTC